MPYILPERRDRIDPEILDVIEALRDIQATDGELNYTITRLLLGTIVSEVRYTNINTALGILEGVKLELYRRMAGPYEDTKVTENGDVYNA